MAELFSKHCEFCGKIFTTEYASKIFCDKDCARKARFERDESFYEFPHEPNAEPLFTFECSNCGKTVNVYSKYDQRNRFCCGKCAKNFKRKQDAMRYAKKSDSNIGMSGGMSLGSLIRREAGNLK
ncbi:MAG: hypothetical protein IJS29_08880 [Selenomonadaceae bacterium]|nr:hypothetical protein [Selenomonadaceae bacterium]